MKIAIFTELFYPYLLGGGEKRYYEIAKRLVKMGHDVSVYTMHIEGSDYYEEHEGIKIIRLGHIKHPINKRSLKPMPFYLLSLMLQKIDADIIDCNTYFPCIAGARIKNIPVVATIHDVYKGHWGESLGNKNLDKIGDTLEKYVCEKKYAKIICPSNATINLLLSEFVNDTDKVLIPNGIDLDLINSIDEIRNPKQICYVGRLVPHKHIEDLIIAVEKLKDTGTDVKCKICGDGILREQLENMVLEKNLSDCIQFTGYVKNYSDMIKIMKQSQVFVNPSTQEGFGIVMIEAMACGCRVVGYDLPAYKDFCNVINMKVAPKRDVESLTNLIYFSLGEGINDNGIETASKYDWDVITQRTEDVYNEVMAK